MLRPFLIFSVVTGTTAAFAAPVKLNGDDLKAKLNGALIEMDTPLGTKIPVRFGTDGLVSGEARDLAPLLGSAKDRGRWWIDGDRICSKWFRWFDAEPQCLTVQQDGTKIFWREDGGKTGTATLVEEAPAKAPEPPATIVAKADTGGPASPARPTAAQPKKTPPAAEPQQAQPQIQTAQTEARAEPLPLPVRAPERPRDVRVAVVPPSPIPSAASAPDAPEANASVETASVLSDTSGSGEFSDVPMMKFGGAGLLEASARFENGNRIETGPSSGGAQVAPIATQVADTPKPQNTPVRVAALPKASSDPAPRAKAAPSSQPPREAAPAARSVPVASTASSAPAAQNSWTSGPSTRGPGLYRVQKVQRRDVLNVRRGPSDRHAAVGQIPANGRRVEVTGACVGDWCPVRYRRASGWVHSFYLAEEQQMRGSASRVYLAQP